MQSWQLTIDRTHGPIYLAIANAIGLAIAAGDLAPGDLLPSHRKLAASLQVDLTTITRAYTEAQRRGLLTATVGRGTFVHSDVRTAKWRDGRLAVDMSRNLPPLPSKPLLRQLLEDGLQRLLRQSDIATLMTYRAGADTERDRISAAAWLRPLVGDIGTDRILICGGAQTALTALLTLLAGRGDTILTEPLTYPHLRGLAAHLGLRLAAVAADEGGLVTKELDRACQEMQPKAIYCIPTIQNPTTTTIPQERRAALAEVALRHGVPVIEDDPYGLLPQVALPAITALAPRVGFYISSISKCLSPGLRVAFVVAPDTSQALRLAEAIRATSAMASPVMIELVTSWIRDGTASTFRNAVRQEAVARQLIARNALPAQHLRAHPEGLHVWMTLPVNWNSMYFSQYLRRLGLALTPREAFLVAATGPNAVRISLGPANSREVLRTALGTVAEVMRTDAPGNPPEVV